MYLPTFWKLAIEANIFRFYYISGWMVPVTVFGKLRAKSRSVDYISFDL